MGIFSKLFRKSGANYKYVDTMNGFTPIFSQFGKDVYKSDAVQQCVNCIVQEMGKLRPSHIRETGMDSTGVNGDIQTVLNNPNPLMTTSDFLEKITWQLFFNYNSFIIPTFYTWTGEDGTLRRHFDGLYPVQPSFVDFIEDGSGEMFVKLHFANNYETTIRYSDVIHIRHKFSVNEFMGGNESGQPDNEALLKTLELNDTMLQGVAKAMKASFAVNAVVKYDTLLDDGTVDANIKELEKKLRNNESGILGLDTKGSFSPIDRKIKLVDADTLKFIDEKIIRNYGVSLPILTGDYTPAQYEAFYQKTLEPLIIKMSQAFTKALFTQRERSFGNKIKFFPKDLVFMSTQETLEMIRLLGDSGTLFENEKRVFLGLPPSPELAGIRKQSLNYVDVNIANQYQIDQKKKEGEEDGGKEDDGEETPRE